MRILTKKHSYPLILSLVLVGTGSFFFGNCTKAFLSVNVNSNDTDSIGLNANEGALGGNSGVTIGNGATTAPVNRNPASSAPIVSQYTPAQLTQNGIVYVRVPRSVGTHTIIYKDQVGGTVPQELTAPDAWDRLPDSRHKFFGFNAPGQLVYLPPNGGAERVLFDCVGHSRGCVPLDPSVSLDGTKIIFSVYFSDSLINMTVGATSMPNMVLGPSNRNAQIFIVDIASGAQSAWPALPLVHDVSPIWLPNGRIMFASTRAGTRQPWLDRQSPTGQLQPQLFTADQDGSNVLSISPHELSTAIHPYLLSGGSVAYSSHWLSHNLAYVSTNGSLNFPTTLGNMWMISDIDINGGNTTALLGAHRAKIVRFANARTKTFKALHFLGQRTNEDICVANYYRGNNLGLGDIFCWSKEPKGIEGRPDDFLPRKMYDLASWSSSEDDLAGRHKGVFLGKIGYPEGVADNQVMLTLGRGFCFTAGGTFATRDELASGQPNNLACDTGIYQTTQIPSLQMNDLEVIVDRPEYHEFSARAVVARVIQRPPIQVLEDQRCLVASSDAGNHEVKPHFPYKFNNNYKSSSNHGGKIDGVDHSELAGMRFWEVLPNKGGRPANFRNSVGNKLKFLGDVPLLADKSFAVQLPCDTPYIMAGIDINGDVIMRDQIPQSLRPGEERVCLGCHLHSQKGRPYSESLAYLSSPWDLTTSSPVPVFTNDIEKIFVSRCVSCHDGTLTSNENFIPFRNYNDLVWDFTQSKVPVSKKLVINLSDSRSSFHYGLHRPYTSKYVNNMFARESLLYWKAAGRRMDGRTDATYSATTTTPNDIDYGLLVHPDTGITAIELAKIGLWLDSGAPK